MVWRPDWFMVGMALAVFLAWLVPGPGASGGALHPEILTKAGVALIFFLHGLLLSFAALKDGAARWRLHLVVQASTFLLFPALGFGMLWLGEGWVAHEVLLGVFFLCALPSTVSSSVAMVAAAKGNVPVAVFNATLSSVIGVLATPFWMSLMVAGAGKAMPLGDVILDLVRWVVLPLVVGQGMRCVMGGWAARHKRHLTKIDRGTILLLVYTSFCDSFAHGVWTAYGAGVMLVIIVAVALLFFVVLRGLWWGCDRVGMAAEYRAAVVFCGTKKSMATGVPMARLMFGASPELSLILLPVMLYHPLQLVVCSWLAGHWARQSGGKPEV